MIGRNDDERLLVVAIGVLNADERPPVLVVANEEAGTTVIDAGSSGADVAIVEVPVLVTKSDGSVEDCANTTNTFNGLMMQTYNI